MILMIWMALFARFRIDANLSALLAKLGLEQWSDGILMNIGAPLSLDDRVGLHQTMCDILNGGSNMIKMLVLKSSDGKVVFTLDGLHAMVRSTKDVCRSSRIYKLYEAGLITDADIDVEKKGTKGFPIEFELCAPNATFPGDRRI